MHSHPIRFLLAAAVTAVLAGVLAIQGGSPAAAARAGCTYYVDAARGNDAASGLGKARAWRSLDRVNRTTFRPGDRILLRAGQRWRGQLWPKGSGSPGAPITVDSYGAGAKPGIDGAGLYGDAVRLSLPSGTEGLTVDGAGGAVEVVETPSATDKSVRLTRRTNSGSTSVGQAFTPALPGIVTVEATIMCDEPYVSGNHYFGVPYIRGTSGQNAISVAFTKNTIVAYEGTTMRTVGAYELGRWYRIRAVIDTVNQRFDLYLDAQQVLDDAAFRTTMDAVAQVDYYASSSNYGSIHIDDLRVSQGVALGAAGTR